MYWYSSKEDCTFPNSDFDSIPAVTPPFYWFPVSSQDLQKPDRIPITSDRMSNVRIKRGQNIPLSLKTSNLQLNLCLFKTIKGHVDLCAGFRWEKFILKKGEEGKLSHCQCTNASGKLSAYFPQHNLTSTFAQLWPPSHFFNICLPPFVHSWLSWTIALSIIM